MQHPERNFIEDDENTMRPAASSSIMGFVDQVLNVRYGNYTQEKFDQLLDEFCQIAIGSVLGDESEPIHPSDIKKKIIKIMHDTTSPELLSAAYFDSKANDGEGANVTATYYISQIFNLVLAATLDDAIYKVLGTDTTPEQLLENKKARVKTLFASLFGKDRVGIAGRCNQGVRHELVGCLNGVYPKGPGEYWYFIEDMQAAVGLQISDRLAKIVSYNIDSMSIKLESVLEFSLKEFWELSEYAIDGNKMPVFIQDIQSVLEPELILWAKEHFVNPSSALEYFNLNAANSIAATTMEHALKVPLFRAWDQLSACAFSSYGTWLSASGGKPAIDAVINWITEQTLDKLTELKFTKDQVNHLITLGRLLTDGTALDLLDVFGEDLKSFGTKLSNLLKTVDSIEEFWTVPFTEFNKLALDIHIAIDAWSSTCSSESLLWRLIDLKQGRNVQIDLTHALDLFKQRCVQEPATWLAMSDIKLLVDALGNPQTGDILVWATVNNYVPISKYLVNSILSPKPEIIPPTHGILSKRERIQALVNVADDCDLVGIVAVILMQQADKTAQDRADAAKLMTMQNQDGFNCLMTAINNANTELAVSIIQGLSNESNLLSTVLTQQDKGYYRNCLMLASERRQFAVVARIIRSLLGQPDTLRVVLTQQNLHDRNCLMLASESKQPEIARQIIKSLAEQPEVLKTVLTQQDVHGRNCMMLALSKEQLTIAAQVIDALSEQPEMLTTVLNQRDNSGQSCQSILYSNSQYSDIAGKIEDVLHPDQDYYCRI